MSLAKDVAVKIPPVRRLIEQRDALQRENAELRKQVRSGAIRDDLQYVFIVTYGRSGSTLLQGLLNSIPGYLIRGENHGTIETLITNFKHLNHRKETISGGAKPTHPWYWLRNYSRQEAAAGYRRFMLDVILKPRKNTRVAGFKEIRWWKADLAETLELTREIFPGARFVFNTRNAEDVIKSQWWAAKDPDVARAQVADWESRMDAAHASLGDDAIYRIHYDDYVADPEILRGLFEWLGEEFDRARIDEVLGTPHSF